jgi:hypothetical protein
MNIAKDPRILAKLCLLLLTKEFTLEKILMNGRRTAILRRSVVRRISSCGTRNEDEDERMSFGYF